MHSILITLVQMDMSTDAHSLQIESFGLIGYWCSSIKSGWHQLPWGKVGLCGYSEGCRSSVGLVFQGIRSA